MKITSSNCISQYKSKYFEMLKESAGLKKPLDRMTKGDCNNLNFYLTSIKFRMGITPSEIKGILAKEGVDFINATVEFLAQKLGFSEDILPPVFFIKGTLGGAQAGYVPEQNVVYLSDSYNEIPKSRLFALLRHEYQHAIQAHNIFRTEGLGEDAVEYYANKTFNVQKELLFDFAKNYSVRELIAQGLVEENGAILVSELSKALQNNDTQSVDNLLSKFKQGIVDGLNAHREKLIREKGVIKADSKPAKFARECFEDFKNLDYYDNDGKIDYGKHSTKVSEIEAECSQLMAESEMNQVCFIRQLKNNQIDIMNSKEYLESIDKVYEEYHKS